MLRRTKLPTLEIQNELFALCTDMENGGLGIFIYLLENMLLFVRPRWEDICAAYKKDGGPDGTAGEMEMVTIDRNTLRQSSRFQMRK